MALKDLLALVDDKLKDVFERETYDPAKDRDKMVKRITSTREKFSATEPSRGRKDYSVANNVVRYAPTLNGKTVRIGGRDYLHVPSERFPEFLNKFEKEVHAGEFDKDFEASRETTATTTRKPRAPMTAEAKAAMAAKRKATMKARGTTPGRKAS